MAKSTKKVKPIKVRKPMDPEARRRLHRLIPLGREVAAAHEERGSDCERAHRAAHGRCHPVSPVSRLRRQPLVLRVTIGRLWTAVELTV